MKCPECEEDMKVTDTDIQYPDIAAFLDVGDLLNRVQIWQCPKCCHKKEVVTQLQVTKAENIDWVPDPAEPAAPLQLRDSSIPPTTPFTEEQRRYLAWLLRLPCCHVSGLHDPTHFNEQPHACRIQKSKAWKRICRELNIDPPQVSRPTCGWCEKDPKFISTSQIGK